MFKISSVHFNAFSEERVKSFISRMVDRLRHSFPKEIAEQKIQERDLFRLVQQGIKTAESYGVFGEMDVELFIDCLVLLSPRFDTDPEFTWAGDSLRRQDIDGTAKMDLIHNWLVFFSDKAR